MKKHRVKILTIYEINAESKEQAVDKANRALSDDLKEQFVRDLFAFEAEEL